MQPSTIATQVFEVVTHPPQAQVVGAPLVDSWVMVPPARYPPPHPRTCVCVNGALQEQLAVLHPPHTVVGVGLGDHVCAQAYVVVQLWLSKPVLPAGHAIVLVDGDGPGAVQYVQVPLLVFAAAL